MTSPPLLQIRDLRLEFVSGATAVRAVDGVTLRLAAGRTLCLVGESGSGKTATALSIAGLVPCPPGRYAGGEVLVQGRDVLRMQERELRRVRGGVVGYIFQDPAASLNPVMRIGTQIREALKAHRPERASQEESVRLLRLVGIPSPELRVNSYPFQLSGGMQQRAMIAMALATEPRLLVADEPTTALDVTIQAQILELLQELQRRLNMAILLITHNLGVVASTGGEVAVMYAGQIVEQAPARALLEAPLHPYTAALLNSIPRIGSAGKPLLAIPGGLPRPGEVPAGCRFAPRCQYARPICFSRDAELERVRPSRSVRCHLWENLGLRRDPGSGQAETDVGTPAGISNP